MENSASTLVGDLMLSNDMPQKRLYRSRAHCNPLSQNDGFGEYY